MRIYIALIERRFCPCTVVTEMRGIGQVKDGNNTIKILIELQAGKANIQQTALNDYMSHKGVSLNTSICLMQYFSQLVSVTPLLL
jgi:hypothetical protein